MLNFPSPNKTDNQKYIEMLNDNKCLWRCGGKEPLCNAGENMNILIEAPEENEV